MKAKAKIIYISLAAILGWFGIVLQFYLILANQTSGNSFWMRFFNFFSYFTILTNLLVALSLTFTLLKSKSWTGWFFSNPIVHTAIAMYILIVGIVYFFILSDIWDPKGLNWLANVILHYVIPIMYVVYWFLFVNKSGLKWSNSLMWLIYPAVYFIYSLIRGEITKWYPYPFLDVNKSGYADVLKTSAVLLGAIIIASLIFIGIGKASSKPAGNA